MKKHSGNYEAYYKSKKDEQLKKLRELGPGGEIQVHEDMDFGPFRPLDFHMYSHKEFKFRERQM